MFKMVFASVAVPPGSFFFESRDFEGNAALYMET
jgi:hypothetical protein